VHRMRWVDTGEGYQLVVVPLHGRENKGGEGRGVEVMAYKIPLDVHEPWHRTTIDGDMHMTHNADVIEVEDHEAILLGGKEGAKKLTFQNGSWQKVSMADRVINDVGFGEIRQGRDFIAGIQPFHGNTLVIYSETGEKLTLTDSLNQGHALAIDELLGKGQQQIVVGWRNPNDNTEMGIRIYHKVADESKWHWSWIDRNGMACEDLRVADLNGDGKKDIIASGRSTKNLKVYWNWTGGDAENDRWDSKVKLLMTAAKIPGVSMAVLEKGNIRYTRSYGLKNTESKEPVEINTQFEAASLTKPVIAYAVCQLALAGKIDLDKPLVDYWTYPGIQKSERSGKVTARMVLTHTTGLPNWRQPRNAEQVKLQHDPASWFSYSGEGFVYLAKVCEAITGLPTHKWIEQVVFQPLGMWQSSLIWEEHFEQTAASPHGKDGKPSSKWKAEQANAAASLTTTAGDYARFMIALLHGEGLTSEWRDLMLSTRQKVDPSCSQCKAANTQPHFEEVSWGLGIGLEQGKEEYLWHWGDNGNFKSYVCVSRDSGDGIVYLANSSNGLAIRDQLVEMILPGKHPAHEWVTYEQIEKSE
ncbi:MAG: beta-lactamase family protein, partial [Saprospiraceae bacterium]|nr:beta-lactamase family protein [Saprospiraceae bacterium]